MNGRFSFSIDSQDLFDGEKGFITNPIFGEGFSKSLVSNGGDINGDGFDDLVIGAKGYNFNGKNETRETYIVFGGNNISDNGMFELSTLNGDNGVVIKGIAPSSFENSVSNGGDINGDGFDDLVVDVSFAGSNDNKIRETYIVFGKDNISDTGIIELSSLNGDNGVVIKGIEPSFENSVSNGGDINGDGFNDLVIGSSITNLNGNKTGETYIVFGEENISDTGIIEVSSLNGDNGVVIKGIGEASNSGDLVSNGGDINGDGFDDLIITPLTGKTYIVFGKENISDTGIIELSSLNADNGIVIEGIRGFGVFNTVNSVSNGGDINGDGFDDLIIGVNIASPIGRYSTGQVYIIFGGDNISDTATITVSSLNGDNGIILNGFANYDNLGSSVSNGGDINGDGFDDLIIGARRVSSQGLYSGETYIVFGGNNISDTGTIEISSLNGDNGIVIEGISRYAYFGSSVSNNGDLNGDGIDDLVIGRSGYYSTPETYIIFGSSNDFDVSPCDVSSGDDNLTNCATPFNDGINGFAGNDTLNGGGGNDVLIGSGGIDILLGSSGKDFLSGGKGNDILQGNLDDDFLRGQFGADLLKGGNGNDFLTGGFGSDSIGGGNGNDNLFGNEGNDTLSGWIGDDFLLGGKGSDLLFGKGGDDFISGNDGDDILKGNSGNDKLKSSSGNDTLIGGLGDDTLSGGANDDFLKGNNGNDILFGNNGNDTLVGGNGNDTLFGGDGADIFILKDNKTSIDRVDIIDFTDGVDKLAGLTFNDVIISSSTNDELSTFIYNDNSIILAFIPNVSFTDITANDFIIS